MGERVILVLGGGGMKGLAHVGVLRALQEFGVDVAELVGTSIGALVGACAAGGMGVERLTVLARELTRADIATLNRWAVLFNGIRQPSVFRDDVFRAYIDSVLPLKEWGQLHVPLAVNAVDLATGRQEWFGAGGREDVTLADAVYASCALPVFYPPALVGGRYYVDGGLTDGLPVRRAADRGADRIIAVDVGAGGDCDAAEVVAQGMVSIQQRAMQIVGNARKRDLLAGWTGPELLYIRPALDGYATFDFASTEYFLEEGYRAARAALAGGGDAPAHTRVG